MKIKVSIVAGLLLGTVSWNAYATTAYRVIDLGSLGGGTSRGYGLNDKGEVVGRSRGPELTDGSRGEVHSFYYSNGNMKDLGTLGGDEAYGRGINNNGQIVGNARFEPDNTNFHAFVYENNTLKDLGTLGGKGVHSRAEAINEKGQIVGWSDTDDVGASTQAYLYEKGTMKGLGTLGGQHSNAFDINNNGLIVGTASKADTAEFHAFSYQNDLMTDLGTLATEGTGFSEARGVNDLGQIVGYSMTDGGAFHAFLYENGTMNDLGSLHDDAYANAINNKGQIVGDLRVDARREDAFLYENGEMVYLDSLMSAEDQAKWKLQNAWGINENGAITGFGTIKNEGHAFLLQPVPLPASIFLMTPALGLLGFMSKRRKPV